MENNDKKTIRRFEVTSYDTDVSHFLKPGAFMDLAQEIAYVSATSLGFGYEDLQRYGTAWVLSRMHIEFPAPPRWRDEVELQTWHKGFEGPFYVRDFRMLGADGQPAVLATSSWLIIDVESRRLLRREHLAEKLPLDTQCSDSAIDEPCGKVQMPGEGISSATPTMRNMWSGRWTASISRRCGTAGSAASASISTRNSCPVRRWKSSGRPSRAAG